MGPHERAVLQKLIKWEGERVTDTNQLIKFYYSTILIILLSLGFQFWNIKYSLISNKPLFDHLNPQCCMGVIKNRILLLIGTRTIS